MYRVVRILLLVGVQVPMLLRCSILCGLSCMTASAVRPDPMIHLGSPSPYFNEAVDGWGKDPAADSGGWSDQVTDMYYWRHEPAYLYVKMPNELDMKFQCWLWGTGTPAVLRNDLLSWTGRSSETYYCRISYCRFLRKKGYHSCSATHAVYDGTNGTGTCPSNIYVKYLCPTTAPAGRKGAHFRKGYCSTQPPTRWHACFNEYLVLGEKACLSRNHGQCHHRKCICPKNSCLVHNTCTEVQGERAKGLAKATPAGIRVCINSEDAPDCAEDSRWGYLHRNRLRVLYSKPRGSPKGDVYQCEYLIFNCQVLYWLSTTWDTSIRCSWKRVKTLAPKLEPPRPSACPSIAADAKEDNMKVLISFGVGGGDLQAKITDTLGVAGPMLTTYATCAAQKCDFNCTLTPETCAFKCCHNTRFVREHGHLLARPEAGGEAVSYTEICTRSGFAQDVLLDFQEAPYLFEQRLVGMPLVALKVLSLPGMTKLVKEPYSCLVFCVSAAIFDWINSHRAMAVFEIYTADFPLYEGHVLTVLKGKGLTIDEQAELQGLMAGGAGDPKRAPLMCRLLTGFVFVFLQSLVNTMATLLSATLVQALSAIDGSLALVQMFTRIFKPVRKFLVKHARKVLPKGPITEFFLNMLTIEALRDLLASLMGTIERTFSRAPLKFFSSRVLSDLLRDLMIKTGVCDVNKEPLQLNQIGGLWKQVGKESQQFLQDTGDQLFGAPSLGAQETRTRLVKATAEVMKGQMTLTP